MRKEASTSAASLLNDAREKASEIERDAKQAAARLERSARANVEVVVAEGRRSYEHLRAVELQGIDRLTSVEFLVRQARERLSGDASIGAGKPRAPIAASPFAIGSAEETRRSEGVGGS